MFLGTYEPRLDEKGRLILPAKYRDQLQGGLVMTRGQEHCLYVFPYATFVEMQEQLQRALQANKNGAAQLAAARARNAELEAQAVRLQAELLVVRALAQRARVRQKNSVERANRLKKQLIKTSGPE